MRGLSVAFSVSTHGQGRERCVGGKATLTCGCRVRHVEFFPCPTLADQAREDGKAKLIVIRKLEADAKAHDHELQAKQQVLRRVTRRLKS